MQRDRDACSSEKRVTSRKDDEPVWVNFFVLAGVLSRLAPPERSDGGQVYYFSCGQEKVQLLNIQILYRLRMRGDKGLARGDVVTHQDIKYLI